MLFFCCDKLAPYIIRIMVTCAVENNYVVEDLSKEPFIFNESVHNCYHNMRTSVDLLI